MKKIFEKFKKSYKERMEERLFWVDNYTFWIFLDYVIPCLVALITSLVMNKLLK